MADPVVIQGAPVGEKEEAVFLRSHLDLLVGGFEVETGPDQCTHRVFGTVGKAKV